MLGRIGSGLTPPKNGLRSVCSSRTVSRPSPMSRVYHPAPEPYRFSTSRRCSAARILSRSTMLSSWSRNRGYASKVSTRPARRHRRSRVGGQLVLGVLEHRGLDRGQHLRRGGAGIGLDLEPVVGPRVVAGGDDDAGTRASSRVKKLPTWVGTASGGVKLRMSWAARTSTQARAKCSEAKRRSWQTTTPRSAAPVRWRCSATPGRSAARCGRCSPRDGGAPSVPAQIVVTGHPW